MSNDYRKITLLAILVGSVSMTSMGFETASAQIGTILAQFPAAPDAANGRGMGFDDTDVYYTLSTGGPLDLNIYKMSTAGAPLLTLTPPGGDPRDVAGIGSGPLAWDGTDLYTMDYQGSAATLVLYRVSSVTGATLSSCDIATANPGHVALPGLIFPDGLGWSGSEIIASGEISTFGGNVQTSVVNVNPTTCVISSHFFSPGAMDGQWSGVDQAGTTLWHGVPVVGGDAPGTIRIEQSSLGGVLTGTSFVTVLATEDIDYDPITFAPKCALWANDAAGANTITAYEIPCTFPKGVGGEYLTMDSTALFISGMTANVSMLIPVLTGIAVAGIYFTRSLWQKVEEN